MKIHFPRDTGQKYYGAHYKFLYNIFKFMNLDIELYVPEFKPTKQCGGLILEINKKRILIDYWNFLRLMDGSDDFDFCFKYHYSEEHCGQNKNVYPIGTISFHDWGDYFRLRKVIKYNCNTDLILNNQRARHGARDRRINVRKMLKDEYGGLVDVEITNKREFWSKINYCLVSICVPGQRNDSLDRGQFQYMAFGACTISPRLNMVLPYMQDVVPGVHYIECADDYSDLIEKIEWCKDHRPQCIEIGNNAKKLFWETCVPSAIWEWMCMILEKEAS